MPPEQHLALGIVDGGLGRAQRRQVRRYGSCSHITGRCRVLREAAARREEIARLDKKRQAACSHHQIYGEKPRLTDRLPFLPEELRIDLGRGRTRRLATMAERQQGTNVVGKAD